MSLPHPDSVRAGSAPERHPGRLKLTRVAPVALLGTLGASYALLQFDSTLSSLCSGAGWTLLSLAAGSALRSHSEQWLGRFAAPLPRVRVEVVREQPAPVQSLPPVHCAGEQTRIGEQTQRGPQAPAQD